MAASDDVRDQWRRDGDERHLLARISPARTGVVHSLAFTEHSSVTLGGGFLGAAALVSDFAHAFFLGRSRGGFFAGGGGSQHGVSACD